MSDAPAHPDHRSLAVSLYNEVWTLLEAPSRTARDDDRMVHAAHASRFHWDEVGGDQERAIGEWQCSRVYAALGRAEPALAHAGRCVVYAGTDGVAAWVAASAQEGLARALLVAGDLDGARAAAQRAEALAAVLEDEEDREVVLADLASLPFP